MFQHSICITENKGKSNVSGQKLCQTLLTEYTYYMYQVNALLIIITIRKQCILGVDASFTNRIRLLLY